MADALRTFVGGLLKTSPGNMLPYDNTTYFTPAQIAALNMANDAQAVPESQLFAAGDVRAQREPRADHARNAVRPQPQPDCRQVAKGASALDGRAALPGARKLNIAEYQEIIYNGWIPAVLGGNALPSTPATSRT